MLVGQIASTAAKKHAHRSGTWPSRLQAMAASAEREPAPVGKNRRRASAGHAPAWLQTRLHKWAAGPGGSAHAPGGTAVCSCLQIETLLMGARECGAAQRWHSSRWLPSASAATHHAHLPQELQPSSTSLISNTDIDRGLHRHPVRCAEYRRGGGGARASKRPAASGAARSETGRFRRLQRLIMTHLPLLTAAWPCSCPHWRQRGLRRRYGLPLRAPTIFTTF